MAAGLRCVDKFRAHTSSDHDMVVMGQACKLCDDPLKSLEINQGSLLVPWFGDKGLMIDRYDCRGYLADISVYDTDHVLRRAPSLSIEEQDIEKLCDYERYLELREDLPENVSEEEENARSDEFPHGSYSAVGFSYDNSRTEVASSHPETKGDSKDIFCSNASSGQSAEPTDLELPYEVPHDLALPNNIIVPATDKQAQIIERTAVFIARQGQQMEIVLKTKQAGNPLFCFLDHDHELNKFYRELVRLIKASRYVPRLRQTSEKMPIWGPGACADERHNNKTINDDQYEIKLPKVDISNTAYASLINKFKKANEKPIENPVKDISTNQSSEIPESGSLKAESNTSIDNEIPDSPVVISSEKLDHVPSGSNIESSEPVSDASVSTVANALLAAGYENCYQEYYRHYYMHYYLHYASRIPTSASTESTQSLVVQEAAKAAATAASAAVNAVHQARLKIKAAGAEATLSGDRPVESGQSEQRCIIEKMAEYVARNGPDFEQIVAQQKANDPRFTFLQVSHPFHAYYLARKKELSNNIDKSLAQAEQSQTDAVVEEKSNVDQTSTAISEKSKNSNVTSTDSDSIKPSGTISFKLMHKSSSSSRLRSAYSATTKDRDPNGSSFESNQPVVIASFEPLIQTSTEIHSCSPDVPTDICHDGIPGLIAYDSSESEDDNCIPQPDIAPVSISSINTQVGSRPDHSSPYSSPMPPLSSPSPLPVSSTPPTLNFTDPNTVEESVRKSTAKQNNPTYEGVLTSLSGHRRRHHEKYSNRNKSKRVIVTPTHPCIRDSVKNDEDFALLEQSINEISRSDSLPTSDLPSFLHRSSVNGEPDSEAVEINKIIRDSPPSTDLNLANNEQLMADRRRRAALLVARLKQEQFAGSSPPSTIAEEACFLSTVSTSDRPQTGKNSDCRFNSNSDPASPNPAIPLGLDSLHSLSLPLSARPDSVSIAVAQAVVAGLNRAAVRHESTDPFLFELNHDESSSNSNLVDLKDCPVQKKKKHRSFKQENGHRSGSKSSRFTKMTHRHERTPPAAYNADTRTLKTKYSKYIHQYSSRSPSSHSSVNCESDASESKSLPRSRSHHSRYEDRPGHKRHRD